VTAYASPLLVALLVTDLYMVSTSRIDASIKATVLQAMLLALAPFALVGVDAATPVEDVVHIAFLGIATFAIKGAFIPWMLFRALRGLGSNREFEPYVSLHVSQLVNGALIGVAFWIASELPWPAAPGQTLAFGVGLATLLVGLYMTVNRRKALSQVLGYLVMESGLFVIGWAMLRKPSFAVELGVLLDVLVAIMVMGVLVSDLDVPADEVDALEAESSEAGAPWSNQGAGGA
jgi:hydrogenase-4 component E